VVGRALVEPEHSVIDVEDLCLDLHVGRRVVHDGAVELPVPGQSMTTPETRARNGLELQKQIVGSELVEKLYTSAPADQQHIQRYLSANCFGDHLTRTGIDVPTRELLTFSMLVALGGCDPEHHNRRGPPETAGDG